jgi:AbrB family looped-hinge helix DNA binding protein
MKTTIDFAGRLVIPKEIRQEIGLRPGTPLEISLRGSRIEIEPANLPVRLVRKGRLMVAIPEKSVELLTAATVRTTRKRLRKERTSRT